MTCLMTSLLQDNLEVAKYLCAIGGEKLAKMAYKASAFLYFLGGCMCVCVYVCVCLLKSFVVVVMYVYVPL